MTYPASQGRMSSFDRVRDRLSNIVPRSDTHFMASCPVHGDRTPSLSVTWVDDPDCVGKTLLKCFGCGSPTADIVEALHPPLTLADLFDQPLPDERRRDRPRVGRSPQQRRAGRRRKAGKLPPLIVPLPEEPELQHHWQEVCRYPYTDPETGRVVQEVVRSECHTCTDADGNQKHERHKDFRQEFITASGKRVAHKPRGFKPVLYRQAEVQAAIAAGIPAWLNEGEKDADTAVKLGHVATTNAQGGLHFPEELAAVFRGGRVFVVLDRDGTGYARGVKLAELFGQFDDIDATFLLPATTQAKSDFTDHVDADLWDTNHPFFGFVRVIPAELAAHHIVTKLRTRLDGRLTTSVKQARLEAGARAGRAADPATDNPELELQRARAWAWEAERRFEMFADQVAEVRRLARESCTPWANEAVTEAASIWEEAKSLARQAYQDARLDIPAPLQTDEELAQAEPVPSTPPPPRTAPTPDTAPAAPGDHSDGDSADQQDADAHRGAVVTAPLYRIVRGRLVEVVTRDGQEHARQVLSLDARIVEMEYLESEDTDDVQRPKLMGREHLAEFARANPPAPEQLTAIVIGFHHPDTGEWMLKRISADDYRDRNCAWLDSLPGPPEYDSRPTALAKLRDALKVAAGGNIRQTVCYRSTGWRRDAETGEWFYVHASGVIDGRGARVAPVMFGGPLARYDLPAPAADVTALRDAFLDHSGTLLTALPCRVAAPLLGHVFRAALGPSPWVLLLVGSPGSYKTSVASLAMHHWGELWDRRSPGSSMSGNGDTLNALRIKLNSAKDALYWADDVAPTRDWTAAQKLLEEFARLVHNGEQRSRSTRDGQGVMDGTPPRSSAIVTSEVTPRPGSSGGERTFPVPMNADEIDVNTLIRLDDYRSRYGRALVMASFLQWLSGNLDKARAIAREEAEQFAEQLRHGGGAVRASQAAGELWAGWVVLSRFLVDTGALAQSEADDLLNIAALGMTNAFTMTTDPDLPTTTGARVRELLSHALRTGIAYVDDIRTGQRPEFPLSNRLGWRRTIVSDNMFRDEPRGIRLGYVLADPTPRDGGEPQLVVWKDALEQVLKETAARMTDAPQVDVATARRALADEGILITETSNGVTRYTVHRTLHCEQKRERMIALRLWPLIGADPDPGDGTLWDDPGPDPDPEPTPTSPFEAMTLREILGAACRSADVASEPSDTDEESAIPDDTAQEPNAQEPDMGVSRAPCKGQIELPLKPVARDSENSADCSASEARIDDGASQARGERPQPDTTTSPQSSAPGAAESPSDQQPATPMQSAAAVPVSAAEFLAPAVVVDVEGVWLPDGTRLPAPDPLTHIGHLAELAQTLRIGHRVGPKWVERGQLWVTAALSERLGVPTPDATPDPAKLNNELKLATAGHPLVTEAIRAGWTIGGDGDRLGAWTRVWRGDYRVWIVLEAGLVHNTAANPILGDSPAPATLARRLGLFTHALNWPFRINPQSTGLDLMTSSRIDRATAFAPTEPVAPERISSCEDDIQWNRKPNPEELRQRFVHAYDRGGSHLGGFASHSLGVGTATHYENGRDFDPKLPGYWRVEVPETGDLRYPHPLLPSSKDKPGLLWVTTPSLEFARECGFELEVKEAYVWEKHARVMEEFYKRMRDARAQLDIEDDADAQLARDLVKACYTRTIGQMGSEIYMRRKVQDPQTGKLVETWREGFAPHRRHHAIAKARANILRFVITTGKATDRWPVAITNDTIVYVSDDPDPESAYPGSRGGNGKRDTWGRGIGQYKWEGSAVLDEHLEYLQGSGYQNAEGVSGKTALVDKEDWDIEQMGRLTKS
ncbi:telomere-binding protein [Nocardia transvalensis]|uniref:telomere-binding protein n=1 Tax=Nocardia transvalensis TaxID=37333 RepID=UPI001895D833|nr:telomere-binding protein [Nocardia transvalensis]MBF6333645.1 telomere-binding protein [Nocardia transvalensis]